MNFYLSILIYMMTQGVLFGIGTLTILLTPLSEEAEILMPIMVGVTMFLAMPIAWIVARMVRLSNPRVNHLAHHIRGNHS